MKRYSRPATGRLESSASPGSNGLQPVISTASGTAGSVSVTRPNGNRARNAARLNRGVLETNQAPVLAALADAVLVEGTELVITNLTTDGDLPTNGLVYSLGTNAPAGMAIDPGLGC